VLVRLGHAWHVLIQVVKLIFAIQRALDEKRLSPGTASKLAGA